MTITVDQVRERLVKKGFGRANDDQFETGEAWKKFAASISLGREATDRVALDIQSPCDQVLTDPKAVAIVEARLPGGPAVAAVAPPPPLVAVSTDLTREAQRALNAAGFELKATKTAKAEGVERGVDGDWGRDSQCKFRGAMAALTEHAATLQPAERKALEERIKAAKKDAADNGRIDSPDTVKLLTDDLMKIPADKREAHDKACAVPAPAAPAREEGAGRRRRGGETEIRHGAGRRRGRGWTEEEANAQIRGGDDPMERFPRLKTRDVGINHAYDEALRICGRTGFFNGGELHFGSDCRVDPAGHIWRKKSSIRGGGGPGGSGGDGGSGGSGGPGACFIADTQILMADGSYKSVEQLQIGDVVKGDGQDNTVIGTPKIPLAGRTLYGFNGSDAFVTAGHPFMTDKGWSAIDPAQTPMEKHNVITRKLEVGDMLITEEGEVEVVSIDAYEVSMAAEGQMVSGGGTYAAAQHSFVFNPMLDGNHTYYAAGYLVHNKK